MTALIIAAAIAITAAAITATIWIRTATKQEQG